MDNTKSVLYIKEYTVHSLVEGSGPTADSDSDSEDDPLSSEESPIRLNR